MSSIGARLRLIVTALVLVLVGAACGGQAAPGAPPVGAGPAPQPATEEGIPRSAIRIAVNPWTGSAVNAQVAKIIIERELKQPVALVHIDEYAQFPALAAGDLDATLEVWPSGHAADIVRYIEGRRGGPLRDGGVVDGGRLGVVGNIGWWVPTYLLAERPELATVEGLRANADLFATPASGGKGQLLLGDPSYVSYDEEIIKNLGLNLQVVRAGSEQALLDALDTAFRNRDPLLLYFWTPHPAHNRYDLTEVRLPAYDEDCAIAARERAGQGYDCDYASDVLFKAFSLGLQGKSPEVFRFLSTFSYTNDDQESIGALVDEQGLDVAAAAEKWVNENEPVWRRWLT
ncbi:glycine betaine ABC transporter substrate-binding protein [Pseudonocardia hispaniensis]|uniref:Glycine betaine ABC transporter substrate-binding protein n=1 Tax=Pseudonocardia hispaniensis TaxID=904933 RepID=A0ABW1IYT8_9PSEU